LTATAFAPKTAPPTRGKRILLFMHPPMVNGGGCRYERTPEAKTRDRQGDGRSQRGRSRLTPPRLTPGAGPDRQHALAARRGLPPGNMRGWPSKGGISTYAGSSGSG
jgi:hypothetical protein